VVSRQQCLALLRQYAMPLTLPALSGDRAARLHTLAQQIKFPPDFLAVQPVVQLRLVGQLIMNGMGNARRRQHVTHAVFQPYQRHNPDDLALDLKVMTARRALETFQQWGDQWCSSGWWVS
jgi:hypothetical protein